MMFFRKKISSSFTALMFASFLFALFVFVSEQAAFAAVTKAQCEALAPGSVCKPANPGCNDLGASATEITIGYCSGVGNGTDFGCCKNIKPPADTNITLDTCKSFPGADCSSSSCDSTKNFLARCVAVGAGYTGYCGQNKTAAAAAAATTTVAATAAATTSATCTAGGGTCIGSGSCTAPAIPAGSCDAGGTCCKPAGAAGASASIKFENPLAFNTVEEVLTSILGTLQGIIVVLALVFIIIGAILYITSAGNEGRMTLAKGAITAAMIGLAIGIAAPSFLKEIGTVLGWGAVSSGPVSGALTLTQIALNVLNFLLSIVGVLAVIMLVIGGIMYLTSAGEEDRIDTGKKIVTYSIVGIAVALAALIIVKQIASLFGP